MDKSLMTVNKICLNLKESIYKLLDEKSMIEFYFSSKVYKYKFLDILKNKNFELENIKYNNKNKTENVDYRDLILIAEYKKIEKRGFYIRILKENKFDEIDKNDQIQVIILKKEE